MPRNTGNDERLTEDEIARRKLGPRRSGRSGYLEDDPATEKEHSQDRRVRRSYRLMGQQFASMRHHSGGTSRTAVQCRRPPFVLLPPLHHALGRRDQMSERGPNGYQTPPDRRRPLSSSPRVPQWWDGPGP